MKKTRAPKKAIAAISLTALSMMLLNSMPAKAVEGSGDDAGVFGSITVTRLAREGLKASRAGDWATAFARFQKAASQGKEAPELYLGLYQAASKNNNWNEAYSALEKYFNLVPEAKAHMQGEYGQALAGCGRYEEAIPLLKKALLTLDADNAFVAGKLAVMGAQIEKEGEKPKADPNQIYREVTKQEVIPERNVVPQAAVSQTSKYTLSYDNLHHYSEYIAICTYEGYEVERDTTYFRPPIAIFHVKEVLMGPPLNRRLPIRFEFNDKTGDVKPPEGWKFGPDKMPKKGSEWLIFIENAVPKRGAFETYHGSFGRQEATEENKNKIYEVIEKHRGQQ